MRCSQARKHIDLRAGTAQGALNARLEEHLNHCPACRQYQAQDGALGKLFDEAQLPDLPDWIHTRIIQQSREHDSRRVQFKHRGRWQMIPTLAAIAVSLYLGGLVGFSSFNFSATASTGNDSSYSNDTEYALFGESSLAESADTAGE